MDWYALWNAKPALCNAKHALCIAKHALRIFKHALWIVKHALWIAMYCGILNMHCRLLTWPVDFNVLWNANYALWIVKHALWIRARDSTDWKMVSFNIVTTLKNLVNTFRQTQVNTEKVNISSFISKNFETSAANLWPPYWVSLICEKDWKPVPLTIKMYNLVLFASNSQIRNTNFGLRKSVVA